MLIDWFTVVAQIANFALLVWLLKRFLYRPVLEAMAARQERVRETVAAAERQKAAAEAEITRLHAQQAELAGQKAAFIKAARDEAKATRDELLAQACKEAEERAATWRESLAREWKEFHEQLSQRTQAEAFAMARQALRDLADADVEERMAAAFAKKLAGMDAREKSNLQTAASGSSRPLLVRSGFQLGEPIRVMIRRALQDQLAAANEVVFETAPGVIAGIEVAFDGHKVAWTFEDFLHSLGENVNSLVQKEARSNVAGT
jgi:F-type H+-transporting ATPase subunit b